TESGRLRSRRGSAGQRIRGAHGKKAVGQVITRKRVKGLSVAEACRHVGISRQAYYQGQSRQRAREAKAVEVVTWVRKKRLRQPRLGTRKLHHLMAETDHAMGRDALFALLRQARLLVPTRRASHKTTASRSE